MNLSLPSTAGTRSALGAVGHSAGSVTAQSARTEMSMPSTVHVTPVDDLIDHDGEDCICGPTTEPVPCDDGAFGWVIIHHSLDGRENE